MIHRKNKMRKFKCLLIFQILCNIDLCLGSRILGIFPFNGKSHNAMFNPLMIELAKRGHKVDMISHYNIESDSTKNNLKTIINLDGTMEKTQNNYTVDVAEDIKKNIHQFFDLYGNRLCHFMGLDEMQKFIKNPPKDPPYNLVITEVQIR